MTFGFSIISLWLRCRSILKNRHVSSFGTRINSLDIPFGAQSHQTAITVNEDTNRSLGTPVSYTFMYIMYIGNGGAFPGNKCGNISPFSFPVLGPLIRVFSVTSKSDLTYFLPTADFHKITNTVTKQRKSFLNSGRFIR